MQVKRLTVISFILNVLFAVVIVFFAIKYHDKIYNMLFPHRTVDIVLFGDSLTFYGDWDELIPGKKIINSGTSGATTTHFTWSIKKDVLEHDPKICFILGGINDIRLGVPPARIISNLNSIIQALQKHNIIPVLQSIIYTSNDTFQNRIIDSVNLSLKQLAAEKAIDYINLNEILSANGFLKEEYTLDGLHLSKAAYPLWADKVKIILAKHNL